MNPRTTAVLFAVAAALFAFIYFYEIRGEPAREEAEEQAKRLFPGVGAKAVAAIDVTTSDGVAARVERRDQGWELTQPLVFPGDQFALDGMASTLAELASSAVIEEPQPPAVYGLDDERRVIRFRVNGEQHALRLGNKTPVGSDSYVATEASERVYTVPSFRVNALSKKLDDLRERRLMHFDREAIDRIEARWPGGFVTLEKGSEGWRVREPLEDRTDERTVEDLLSDLSFLRAEGFVDDPAPDEDVGLDEPAFEVALRAGAESEGGEPVWFRMALGSVVAEGQRMARAAQPSLYLVPEERLEDFPRRVNAYRFRQLARFDAADAERVDLIFQEGEAAPVAITALRADDGWTSAPEPIAKGKTTRILSELSRLRASDIVSDAPEAGELAELELAPPRVILRVYGAEPEGPDAGEAPKLAEVHLGSFDPDRGIVARVADVDTVFRLDYELAEDVPVTLEAFRNRFLSKERDEEEAEDEIEEDE